MLSQTLLSQAGLAVLLVEPPYDELPDVVNVDLRMSFFKLCTLLSHNMNADVVNTLML